GRALTELRLLLRTPRPRRLVRTVLRLAAGLQVRLHPVHPPHDLLRGTVPLLAQRDKADRRGDHQREQHDPQAVGPAQATRCDAGVDETPDDHEAAHEDPEAHQRVAEHLNPLFRFWHKEAPSSEACRNADLSPGYEAGPAQPISATGTGLTPAAAP